MLPATAEYVYTKNKWFVILRWVDERAATSRPRSVLQRRSSVRAAAGIGVLDRENSRPWETRKPNTVSQHLEQACQCHLLRGTNPQEEPGNETLGRTGNENENDNNKKNVYFDRTERKGTKENTTVLPFR